jgi:hypothetical protein
MTERWFYAVNAPPAPWAEAALVEAEQARLTAAAA